MLFEDTIPHPDTLILHISLSLLSPFNLNKLMYFIFNQCQSLNRLHLDKCFCKLTVLLSAALSAQSAYMMFWAVSICRF